MVVDMSFESRAPYFFLEANDKLFKPWIKVSGKDINVGLMNRAEEVVKFTDNPLEDHQKAYFIIAAPST